MKKNDALAFNGCKGQKKNASHRDAVNTFNLQRCSNHLFI